MAEPSLLDPFDPSNPHSLFDPCDPFPLPSDVLCGHDFDLDFDFDFDFSVDDFLRSPENHPSIPCDVPPDPNPGDGSGVSSSSSPLHQSSDLSHDPKNSGPASPDSGNSSAALGVVDKEVKVEEEKNLKRKKDRVEGYLNLNPNSKLIPRSSKLQRSEVVGNEEDEKRKARLMRNRESAQMSRQRKKQYVEELQEKVKSMHSTINELNAKISYVMAENASLRQKLGGSGAPPAIYPPPGPMQPMHFPWIPGYALRPQGSQVPLVPIPRLKPQQPAPAPRAKKLDKKVKKVASVSFLGLFILLVFGVMPGVNLWYRGTRDDLGIIEGRILSESTGRVLSVSGCSNGLSNMSLEIDGIDKVTGRRCQRPSTGTEGSVFRQNSSETLPALLYVPRNGKHVKIDGNLIIHSVLAGEKAMAEAKEKRSPIKESKETALAIAGNMISALAVSKSEREVDHSIIDNIYGNNLKSTSADGPLQQWLHEGMTGPILSSGMCAEVFQFDISPSSSGVIPAPSIINVTSIVNVSENLPSTSAHQERIKNRRILYPEPASLNGTNMNNTQQFGKPPEAGNFHHTKPASSVVVSILADPIEAGKGDGDAISAKSISRIFVVVLLDSVKYVTYSCVLPFKSSSPIL